MTDVFLDTVVNVLTPEVCERFKRAIELRRWPDGATLSDEQLNICMQAVAAYEYKHLPVEERTGYVPSKEEPCETLDEVAVTWR